MRELAAHTHQLPDGTRVSLSRGTLDRWIRAYRDGGLQSLRPKPRSDQGLVRKFPELLEEACRLRRDLPSRSADQITRILLARHGIRVSPRTVRSFLHRRRRTARPSSMTPAPRRQSRSSARSDRHAHRPRHRGLTQCRRPVCNQSCQQHLHARMDLIGTNLASGSCPSCPDGSLLPRLVAKPLDLADGLDSVRHCNCCGSYWQEGPSGWASFAPGVHTLDEEGAAGPFASKWYEVGGSEFGQ